MCNIFSYTCTPVSTDHGTFIRISVHRVMPVNKHETTSYALVSEHEN
jgi:hypothetical protein